MINFDVLVEMPYWLFYVFVFCFIFVVLQIVVLTLFIFFATKSAETVPMTEEETEKFRKNLPHHF